jgi:RES domain
VSDAPPVWAGWISEHAAPLAKRAWRGVEAQHVVATMRLVDSLAEQAVLEGLLEASKPPLPEAPPGTHYLLSTPFRYRPRGASRFRRAGTHGLWYGAESVQTACAEVAYWRWRFLLDSAGLADNELLTQHTLFNAGIDGLAIDLTTPPWSTESQRWQHPGDYADCQALAEAAPPAGIQWIRYASVRDPGGFCAAVLDVAALREIDLAGQQTWFCRTRRSGVQMIHDSERFEWVY